jgi:hypothetical protein
VTEDNRNLDDEEAWVPLYRSDQHTAVFQERRGTLDQFGRHIQWVHSYITRDRVYRVYRVRAEPFESATLEELHAGASTHLRELQQGASTRLTRGTDLLL